MRTSSAAIALAGLAAGLTAGLTAGVALRRLTDRSTADDAAPVQAEVQVGVPGADAVVLPFVRPALPIAPAAPTGPVRCGDTGGRTKSGAPCAARASAGGRCHHHPVAA